MDHHGEQSASVWNLENLKDMSNDQLGRSLGGVSNAVPIALTVFFALLALGSFVASALQ